MKSLLVFVFYLFGVLAKHEIYDGHPLYEVDVDNLDQTKILHDVSDDLDLDIWKYPVPGQTGYVLVPKLKKDQFENILDDAGIRYKVEVENIKEQLDLEDQRLAAAAARNNNENNSTLSFDVIHTWETIDAYMEDLGRRYPDLVTVAIAGTSFEGRPIKYLKISTTNFQDTSKPIIMLQSLLHAREWVTLPATLYAIKKLVVDVTESDLVENIDWIILPVANPDGYIWSHTNARFWRKNRRDGLMPDNVCVGVDLNRNFDIFWGTTSSDNVCSEIYHGHGPFSEPETAAIRDMIARYGDRMAMYLDYHSFGSMILFGYGNGQLPQNALVKNLVGVTQAQAIDRVKWSAHPNYIVGNIAMVLYYACGVSCDYVMSQGVPFSYLYELPAYRNIQGHVNGFLVEDDFIEQAGFETWEGTKAGARAVLAWWKQEH